jgi:hypothetical protein
MKLNPVRILATVGVVALAAVGTAAQARDNVYWSLGVQAAPGVSLGVGNVRPVYVAPAPVYVAPAPVYLAPPPVYYVHGPAPVYYSSGHYVRPGKHKGWHNKHDEHRHWD